MAALRFRFATPTDSHGGGGNLALTINADHSVGAGQGSDVRLALAPGEKCGGEPDPVLLRLVAHARAAQLMVESGKPHPMVAHYGKRHFWQLLRVAWLAPDIISAIVEGRQPPDLTGRKLLRATNIPVDWAGQRQMLGFA